MVCKNNKPIFDGNQPPFIGFLHSTERETPVFYVVIAIFRNRGPGGIHLIPENMLPEKEYGKRL